MYYLHNNETGLRFSLETKDKARATEFLVAHNEAVREPAFNLQKARVYLAASDPEVATRTWQDALDSMVDTKQVGSANRDRWETFAKNKGLKPLLKLVLLETRADQLLKVVVKGKVSTNVYLRRLQNFCIGMNWLPWPILPHKLWPPIRHKSRRAITDEEHRKIIAREGNAERRALYELLWHLGGAQSDIACLEAEDIDWNDHTICYNRKKLASLDATQVKPPLIKFGKKCSELLKTLPQTGPIFPYLRTVDCKDRATEFGRTSMADISWKGTKMQRTPTIRRWNRCTMCFTISLACRCRPYLRSRGIKPAFMERIGSLLPSADKFNAEVENLQKFIFDIDTKLWIPAASQSLWELNHRSRGCRQGRTACVVFHDDTQPARWAKRQPKIIFRLLLDSSEQ